MRGYLLVDRVSRVTERLFDDEQVGFRLKSECGKKTREEARKVFRLYELGKSVLPELKRNLCGIH